MLDASEMGRTWMGGSRQVGSFLSPLVLPGLGGWVEELGGGFYFV